MQGYSLGMNAGLGNFGVTTMQIVIPLVMTFGLFGGESRTLVNTSGTLIGKIPAGTETFIQNAGFVWLLALVPLAFLGWWGMNNIRDEHVSPDIPSPIGSFATISFMLIIGFVAAAFNTARDRAILKALLSLRDALDVRFIAEGVETEEIRKFVLELGFDAAQGYAIGRPEPETRIS